MGHHLDQQAGVDDGAAPQGVAGIPVEGLRDDVEAGLSLFRPQSDWHRCGDVARSELRQDARVRGTTLLSDLNAQH